MIETDSVHTTDAHGLFTLWHRSQTCRHHAVKVCERWALS